MTLKEWFKEKKDNRFRKRLAKGKENYGRQGIEPAQAELKPAITARVYRAATNTWEPLEVTVKQRR
ncbi:hypothetical protein LCGC14_2594680 [marine sediment metagenome]|uniref:Uncharacterized protein n=1 Tax=marine sediment metagenome TaxID=412755 RepID=A0A0F9AAJ4_9ZZZZ